MLRRILFSLLALSVLCGTASAGCRGGRRIIRRYRPVRVLRPPRIVRRRVILPPPRIVRPYRPRIGISIGIGSSPYGYGPGYYGGTPFGFGYPYRW